MKSACKLWKVIFLFGIGAVVFLLCVGRSRVSAQTPIEFGVSQDYGAIRLGPGQKAVVENTNNSEFQMRVDTYFIANDGSNVIGAVSVPIPPHNTNEVPFAPPYLPIGCTPGGSRPCTPEAFRVRSIATVTTNQIKPPLDDMCDTLLSAQSIVGTGRTLFVLTPTWTHAWPGSGQLKSPAYSQCRGAH
jgi:hypothetical protein